MIFTELWIGWLLIFLIIESMAIRLETKHKDPNYSGGTLSENIWRLIRGKAWYHKSSYALLLVFFIDLGLHFFVGTALY